MKKIVCSNVAVLVLALALATPAFAGTPAVDPSATGAALSAVQIENFGRVDANYYRGSQPRGQQYAQLASLGIRTVIDLTKDGDSAEPTLVRAAGMKFYRIEMTTHEAPSAQEIAQFLAIVNDPANQPVYVHCQGGRHRTGVMTAVYRITDDHWTADRAFAEMKQYKFGADFLHPEFKQFVYVYRAPATATASAAAAAAAAGNAKQ